MKAYEVGKAQKIVLDGLGVTVESFQEAEALFESIGIVVISVREGRKSVPQISARKARGYAEEGLFNDRYADIIRQNLAQYCKPEFLAAITPASKPTPEPEPPVVPEPADDHEPETYRAYKLNPMSEKRVIWYMDAAGCLRPVDGMTVYESRQNAYAACKRLNHPLLHAMKSASCVEADWDRYTLSVREDEGEDGDDVYTLSICVCGMPPHFQQDFSTLEEIERYIAEQTAFPKFLAWRDAEEEE